MEPFLDVISLPTYAPSDSFELIDRHEAALPQPDLDRITAWLAPTEYLADSSEFGRHRAAQAPGTGVWLCETERWRQWHESPSHGSLWIKGVPGAGKSVLAAAVIEHLRRTEPDVPLVFFFFRHVVDANRRPRSLLRDWLAQLLPASPSLQATLLPLIDAPIEFLSDQVLWECLLKGAASLDRLYCVVDALDEMDASPHDLFFSRMSELASFRPRYVKVLMTSRPQQQDLLGGLKRGSVLHISLEEERVRRDIDRFVSHRLLAQIPSPTHDSVRRQLADDIIKRSSGLFLYARLLVDQVASQLSSIQDGGRSIDVSKLPNGLESMYDTILSDQARAMGISTDVQAFLLGCVIHSMRPLRLRELAGFLSENGHDFSGPITAKVFVRSACGPLLEVLEDETVQVLHHSLTEFLLDPDRPGNPTLDVSRFPTINSAAIHTQMAIICMKVIKISWRPLAGPREPDELDHAVLGYAEKSLPHHVSFLADSTQDEFCDALSAFAESQTEYQWGPCHEWVAHRTGHIGRATGCFGALHLAASLGLRGYAQRLVESGVSTNPPAHCRDRQWVCVPAWWASYEGHDDLVQYFLAITDTSVLQSGSLRSSFSSLVDVAVQKRHPKTLASVLKWFEAAGASPLGFGHSYGTFDEPIDTTERFLAIAHHYDAASLRVTLPFLSEYQKSQLLCVHANRGDKEHVGILLEQGATDPNRASLNGRPPLYMACRSQREFKQPPSYNGIGGSQAANIGPSPGAVACVRALLRAGAAVSTRTTAPEKQKFQLAAQIECNEPCEPGLTALHGLACGWRDLNHDTCVEIFHLLVAAGADVESRDSEGATMLLSLFPRYQANLNIVKPLRFLLESGADISATDASGQTALHRALRHHRDPALIELLVQHGADVNAIARMRLRYQIKDASPLALVWQQVLGDGVLDDEGRPMDRKQAYNKHDVTEKCGGISRILLSAGAHIDADGTDDALIHAASVCDLDILRLFLASRKDPRSLGLTLLRLQETFRFRIIDRETGEASAGDNGDRPLRDIVKLLVEAGASLEERNELGLTPLLASVGHDELFEALLLAGADRTATDADGNSALHLLIAQPGCCEFQLHIPSLKKLNRLVEDLGIDVMKRNARGDTLLHLALALPPPQMWQFRDNPGATRLVPFLKQIISYGIQPGWTNEVGMTPLHCFFEMIGRRNDSTAIKNYPLPQDLDEAITMFEEVGGGFHINAKDNEGITALHMAIICKPSEPDYLDVLISHGADVLALTNHGRNALHVACRAKNTGVIPFLLDQAGERLISQADCDGRTPLYDACMSGLIEPVAMILRAGAQVRVRDAHGLSPLDACAESVVDQTWWQEIEIGKPRLRGRWLEEGDLCRRMNHARSDGEAIAKTEALSPAHELAIYTITKMLLEGGAMDAPPALDNKTPADWARKYGCAGMIKALADAGHVSDGDDMRLWMSTHRAPALQSTIESEEAKAAVLRNPTGYIAQLDLDDVDWLIENDAYFDTLFFAEKSAFEGCKVLHPSTPFLYEVLVNGHTEVATQLGNRVLQFDDGNAKVSRRIVEASAQLEPDSPTSLRRYMPMEGPVTYMEMAANYGVLACPSILKACQRPEPNLEMLRTLVERCGAGPASINARECRYSYQESRFNALSPSAVTALGYMAAYQRYWHLDAMRYLAAHGAEVNATDLNGETPLHIALLQFDRVGRPWQSLFVKLLLELGADPNIEAGGKSPLELAPTPEIFDILVSGGADVVRHASKVMMKGIRELSVAFVQRAIDAGAGLNTPDENSMSYPMQLQMFRGFRLVRVSVPIVAALLFKPESWRAATGSTVISSSDLMARRIAIVKLLLGRGADPFLRVEPEPDQFQQFKQEPEVKKDDELLLHLLLSHVSLDDELIDAVLEHPGINLETRNPGGQTVFLATCRFRDTMNTANLPGLLTKILDRGADITVVDQRGMNVLHTMLSNPNVPTELIIRLVRDTRFPPDLCFAKDAGGRTPLHHALRHLRPEVCALLLDLGADPCDLDPEDSSTPLHHVAAQCFLKQLSSPEQYYEPCARPTSPDHAAACVELWDRLVTAGVSVDGRDRNGEPPLFWYLRQGSSFTSKYGRGMRRYGYSGASGAARVPPVEGTEKSTAQQMAESFVGLFSRHEADLQARNHAGETALHVLAQDPHREHDFDMFKFLVDEMGLDPLLEDGHGRSCLDLCAENEKSTILDMFRR